MKPAKSASVSFRRPAICAFGVAVAFALPTTADAAIFTVTSTGDSGAGTLRTAIQTANTTAGADEIDFGAAGEGTITPLTALPTITEQLTIDGGLAVTLDGSSLSSGEAGLKIAANNCQIVGLSIGNFPGNGTEVGGGAAGAALENNAIGSNGASGISLAAGSSDASIVGNQIGADASGTVARPNALDGIRVAGSSHRIGGTGVGQGNVISGNIGWGIDLTDGSATNPHAIRGNVIGATAAGTGALPNGSGGVLVAPGATGTLVGGALAGQRNLISGNSGPGVRVSATGTTVAGNLIGLDTTGSSALPNGSSGVEVVGVPAGVVVGGAGTAANVISGNGADGVALSAAGVTVKGNLIGTDSAGSTAVGNTDSGVLVSADNGRVGVAGTGNVISGNGGAGVEVDDAGDADGAIIRANRIGTDDQGGSPLPNGLAGIAAREAATIGGTGAGDGNLISANAGPGVLLDGSDPAQASIVRGNTIGLDLTGTAPLGNTGSGVVIAAGPVGFPTDATIGGAVASAENLISANSDNGVFSEGTNVEIAGNTIGVEADGTSAAGNGAAGIRLGSAAQGNMIGGDSAADENTIFHSGDDAIAITGAASGNQIKRNIGSSNAGLFIDLGDDGVGNPGLVQGGVLAPTITVAGPQLARGTAASGATVRVFSKATAANGELEAYLGSATADGSGQWRVDYVAGPTPLPNAKRVVATQTDALDNTSELSDPFALTDAIAPAAPIIQSGPSGPTSDATPTFTFSGEPATALECRIDSGSLVACDAGVYTTAALGDGPHTFFVTAKDLAGNTSAPVGRSFKVDTTAPETTIDTGPSGTTDDSTPTFSFSSNEPGSSFECSIDSGAFQGDCASPKMIGPLSDGPHTLQVRATDQAANTDLTPASRSFTVDTTPDTTAPKTTISKKPQSKIKTNKKKVTVKVTFKSEQGAEFRCKLDKGNYKPCSSPYQVKVKSKSGKGKKHTISIQATDKAGNTAKPIVIKFKVIRKG